MRIIRVSPFPLFVYTLGLFFLAALLHAQDAGTDQEAAGTEASFRVDKTEAEIGEIVTLTIDVPGDAEFDDVEIEFPERQQRLLYLGPLRQPSPGTLEAQIRPLSEGEQAFGPATLKLRPAGSENILEMSTDRFTLNVQPPAETDETQPASYTGPFALPFDYLWRNLIIAGLVLILLLLLCALAALLAALVINRQRQKSIVRPLAPVEAALLEVHNLKSLDVYREFGPERHYTVLSHALRQYLEHQFNRAALEMTEDEVAMMIRHEMSHVPKAETLQEVLERTSMAKFARQALTEEVALEDTRLAETFLQSEQQRLDEERQKALEEQRTRARQTKPEEDRAA